MHVYSEILTFVPSFYCFAISYLRDFMHTVLAPGVSPRKIIAPPPSPLSAGNEQTGELNNKLQRILTMAERSLAAKRASLDSFLGPMEFDFKINLPSLPYLRACTTVNIDPVIFIRLLFIINFFLIICKRLCLHRKYHKKFYANAKQLPFKRILSFNYYTLFYLDIYLFIFKRFFVAPFLIYLTDDHWLSAQYRRTCSLSTQGDGHARTHSRETLSRPSHAWHYASLSRTCGRIRKRVVTRFLAAVITRIDEVRTQSSVSTIESKRRSSSSCTGLAYHNGAASKLQG